MLKRIVEFRPAYDRRQEPENFGVGGVEIEFIMLSSEGAVTYTLLTEWFLPEVEKFHAEVAKEKPFVLRAFSNAIATPVATHHRTPARPDSQPSHDLCPWIGSPCYMVDVTSVLGADEIYQALKREGSEAVWSRLEHLYRTFFPPEG